MAYLQKILAIVAKDILVELRTKEMLSSMFIFSLLVIMIFNFAFELRADNVSVLAPGALWVASTFAGMLGLNRSFIIERDRGSLEGLLLLPINRSAIFFGKFLGNVLFISLVEILMLPFFMVFFNQPGRILFPLTGVIILGTIGFSGVGTLLSAMTIHTRAREVMLPILLFPMVVPVIISAVRLTAAILDNIPFPAVQIWFSMLLAFDIIFMAMSYMLFEFVLED